MSNTEQAHGNQLIDAEMFNFDHHKLTVCSINAFSLLTSVNFAKPTMRSMLTTMTMCLLIW